VEPTNTKPRRAWLAALLSLLGGPIGQVYAGRFRRCMVLWAISQFLQTIFLSSAIVFPLGQLVFALVLLPVPAFSIYLAVDAFVVARRYREVPLKRYQRWWVYVLMVFAFCLANHAVAQTIRFFVAEAFVISDRSMSPMIFPGDRILVDRLRFGPKILKRNEIVVFRSAGPGSPLFVMRVVGLPGDEIEIVDEEVFLNGTKWEDPHAVHDYRFPPYPDLSDCGPIEIAPESFFVLGDNRRISKDSRIIGQIPLSDLYGKARVRYDSRETVYHDPSDNSNYERGPICWDRIGVRLD